MVVVVVAMMMMTMVAVAMMLLMIQICINGSLKRLFGLIRDVLARLLDVRDHLVQQRPPLSV
jgi:hypothetical protein